MEVKEVDLMHSLGNAINVISLLAIKLGNVLKTSLQLHLVEKEEIKLLKLRIVRV